MIRCTFLWVGPRWEEMFETEAETSYQTLCRPLCDAHGTLSTFYCCHIERVYLIFGGKYFCFSEFYSHFPVYGFRKSIKSFLYAIVMDL